MAVVARDRLAPARRCLESVLRHTDPVHPVLAHLGGAPDPLRRELEQAFGDRVRFTWLDRPVYPAVARNQVLATCETELVAFVDTDVIVHDGWLDAMVDGQARVGAAMIAPLILERDHQIHCAGNDLYLATVDGIDLGYKVLRYKGLPYHGRSSLAPSASAYAELHCQLVVAETMRRHSVFDETVVGVEEVDTGMTLAVAGETVWFTPDSVVAFDQWRPIEPVDVETYTRKWAPAVIVDAHRRFAHKWGFDISGGGNFGNFLADTNARLGRLGRARPALVPLSLAARRAVSALVQGPQRARDEVHRRRHGGALWDAWFDELRRSAPTTAHPAARQLAQLRDDAPCAGTATASRAEDPTLRGRPVS